MTQNLDSVVGPIDLSYVLETKSKLFVLDYLFSQNLKFSQLNLGNEDTDVSFSQKKFPTKEGQRIRGGACIQRLVFSQCHIGCLDAN